MDDPASSRQGFTVVDGIAFVIGAALASVLVRSTFPGGSEDGAWLFVAAIFGLLVLTASGPFVLLLRKLPFSGRIRVRPGEALWAVLGIPWTFGAVLRTIVPRRGADGIDGLVGILLAVACLIAIRVAWVAWATPEPESPRPAEPWTEYVGFGLAISWPLQCGLGLVLLGGR